jgi:hypothetical protein
MNFRPRLLLVVLAALLAGCGSTAASASPLATPWATASNPGPSTMASSGASSEPLLASFQRIEAQVQALRSLAPSGPVTPVLLDSKAIGEKLASLNAAERDHSAVAAGGRLLEHLGMLPPGSSLEALQAALESSQVLGFYDPGSKGLFVLSPSGGAGPLERMTFSHEYTHALQDQVFDIDRLALDTADQGDRDLARLSVLEGDASLVMSQWARKYLTALELLQVVGESMGADSDQLAKAPAILRETMLFPYQSGLSFVEQVYSSGGWAAVDKLYANPPNSTSQVLHPELYLAGTQPTPVALPAVPASLPGWKLTLQDTLGELQLRVWLESGAAPLAEADAAKAAGGWAGDRVGLYEGPNGEWAAVLHTTWRSAAGRDEFMSAASAVLPGLASEYRVCGDPERVDIAIASAESIVPAFLTCNTMG